TVRTGASCGQAGRTELVEQRGRVRGEVIEIEPVAVEVDDVVRVAVAVRGAEHVAELLEGGRTQDVELKCLSSGGVEAFEQAARDGAERHIVAAAGAAD